MNRVGTTNKEQGLGYWALVVLIIVNLVLRILAPVQDSPADNMFSDLLKHWLNAVHFWKPGPMNANDPIFYQFYLNCLKPVMFKDRVIAGLWAGLLSCLMPWTYYRAARALGMGHTRSLAVWAVVGWTPSLFTIYQCFMTETVVLVLNGFGLWATAVYLNKPAMRQCLVATTCWTLAILTKPSSIPLAGACLFYCWWKGPRELKQLAAAAALAVVLLIPGTVRNYQLMGFIAPLGNPWLREILHKSDCRDIRVNWDGKEYLFSSPSCNVMPLEPLSDWKIRRGHAREAVRVVARREHGERDWKQAYNNIPGDPQRWVRQLGENVVLFLFAPSWPESSPHTWVERVNLHHRWIWAPLILAILFLNGREFMRRRLELLPVVTTVLTLCLMLQNRVTMEGRYRKPVEPLLLMCAVYYTGQKREPTAPQPLRAERQGADAQA